MATSLRMSCERSVLYSWSGKSKTNGQRFLFFPAPAQEVPRAHLVGLDSFHPQGAPTRPPRQPGSSEAGALDRQHVLGLEPRHDDLRPEQADGGQTCGETQKVQCEASSSPSLTRPETRKKSNMVCSSRRPSYRLNNDTKADIKRRSTTKDKDSEIWTPWVGKRKRSSDVRDKEIWTPWVGKRSGGADFHGEEVGEDDEARDVDWVYPLPQSLY